MALLKMDPQSEGVVAVRSCSQSSIHSLYFGPYHSHFILTHETAEYIPSTKVAKGLARLKTLIHYEFCLPIPHSYSRY